MTDRTISEATNVASVKALENIRGALIAAKNEYPGSRWNDAEHDPLAQFDALVEDAAYVEWQRDLMALQRDEAFDLISRAQRDECVRASCRMIRAHTVGLLTRSLTDDSEASSPDSSPDVE